MLRTLAVVIGIAALMLPGAAAAQSTPFHLAIVPNLDSNDVSILDTDTQKEVARIPVGPRPLYATASPDGQFAYVGEDGFGAEPIRINRINFTTLTVEDVLTVGGTAHLVELEVSPDGAWLVAGDIHRATAHIIDTANWTVTASVVLCQICDGQTQPLFSAPSFAFSADGSTLYAATPVNDLLTLVDLATGTVLDTRPTQGPSGASYTDIERTVGEQVVLQSTHSGGAVRVFDVPGGTSTDLQTQQSTLADIALVPLPTGTLVASGNITYGGDQDFLSLVPLQGGPAQTIPSSESLRYLHYNPVTNEVWATCVGAVGFCVPFQIDVFDMDTLTKTDTISGPSGAATLSRYPAFSPDFEHYYQPMGVLDKVAVVDTARKRVIRQIRVGSNPRLIRMQGDAGPHER